MKIEKIIWPTDLSENAAKALPYVTSIAQQYQAEIHILYVLKEYVAFGAAYGDFNPEEDYKRMRDWEKETAEKRLDELCEKFLESCPLYIRHIDVGDPAQKILDLIKKEGADMVIMANRGRESHFDFGSVAERVLRCTDIPVLTLPA